MRDWRFARPPRTFRTPSVPIIPTLVLRGAWLSYNVDPLGYRPRVRPCLSERPNFQTMSFDGDAETVLFHHIVQEVGHSLSPKTGRIEEFIRFADYEQPTMDNLTTSTAG